MIQLFKIGSAERLLLLLGFFLLAHGPFLFWNDSQLVQELLRLRLGERLADGWKLYAQASDDTGPLPAILYAILAKAGLLHFKAQRFLAAALLWQQAIWFNQMAQRYQLVSERNFLIAFFYLVLAHLGTDAVSLSPALISCSFLLFSLGILFRILKDGASNDDAMWMGLWLGMATISYQPTLLFILPIYLSALFFSGMRVNHYLMVGAAALLPALAVYVFFLYTGGKGDFFTCFPAPFRLQPFVSLTSLQMLLIPASVLLLISLAGWFYSNQNSRVNFHRLGFNVFFFSAIAGFITIFFGSIRTGEGLLLLLPQAAYFMAQLILHSRNRLLNEGLGLGIAILFLGGFYYTSHPSASGKNRWNGLFLQDAPKGFTANFSGKSLLLLSNDFRYYSHNPPASRFFRFYLSGIRRQDSRTYEGLMYWYLCLAENPPQLIYDPNGFIPDLALHMPEFSQCYRASFYPNLYEAIPGKSFGSGK